ncbi:MAG: SRPBCC family protein [Bacteroidales bacterium]
MRALKIFLIVLASIVIAGLFVAVLLPSRVILRSELWIKAPAATLFTQVNNLRYWEQWSPFERNDTTLRIRYTGPEAGSGAAMYWVNARSDSGMQVITQSVPFSFIQFKLDFYRKTSVKETFSFNQESDSTLVSWKIIMDNLSFPMGRWMGLLMPSMMSELMKEGLMNLKKISEANPAGVSILDLPAQHFLLIKDSATMSGIAACIGKAFSELEKVTEQQGLQILEAPFVIYHSWSEDRPMVMEMGFVIDRPLSAIKGAHRVNYRLEPSGRYAMAIHHGAYEKTKATHEMIQKYLLENQIDFIPQPIEKYITDPMAEPDTSQWVTEIYYRLK